VSSSCVAEHAPASPARQAGGRMPVIVVFFVLGAISASWAARIPAIRAPLHLSDQALGLALLGPAAGAVLAMPAAGAVLVRVTPRTAVLAAMVPLSAVLPLVTVVGNTGQLFAALFAWGCCVGVIDVAMNTEAVAVQDRLGRRVMSGFHAYYSIGGLAGAAVGAACAWAGVSVRTQLIAVSAVILVSGASAAARFDPVPRRAARERGSRRARLRWSWVLVALSVMAFASFLAEGAANDWTAVYLHSSLGTSAGLAGAGYTCFAVAMAAGRLCGDRLADRWGPRRLVRTCAALGAAGWGAALILGSPEGVLAGLVLLGFGLSSVVPNVFSRASGLGEAGPAIAVVTFCGYGGMLAGPAAIGALAGAVGLPAALSVEAALAAVVVVLCGALSPRTTQKRKAPQL
jgi:predicted MFS family arabinose efflux permease